MEVFVFVWRAITKSYQSFIDLWAVKWFVALVLSFIPSVHGIALRAFAVLIVVDLLTKWLAKSYACLQDAQCSELGLYACLTNIPEAMRKGYITSHEMKHRFAGKIILYMIVTIMAASSDAMLTASNQPGWYITMAWFYFAATEAMSILENLRDAGVSRAEVLLNFIRDKFGGMFKSERKE